jgi:predicted component of type VI protein secretion system
MTRLLLEHGWQAIKDYPFRKGSVTIGRLKDNTAIFTNHDVSSSHARIDKVGTDYILTDLHSTNGTFVNGLTAGQASLWTGLSG